MKANGTLLPVPNGSVLHNSKKTRREYTELQWLKFNLFYCAKLFFLPSSLCKRKENLLGDNFRPLLFYALKPFQIPSILSDNF